MDKLSRVETFNPDQIFDDDPQDMFSIYILTYNEELGIAACIESALLSDDVMIVDSNQ
ncbi:glycosyltransferase [Moorena producens 3L]|uniref:Glycosyltransferase n=1 Tax=Moorena producens 3L TaxID=489825 RepID=F4XJD7_9CYAN|nr:glycosyltransferase [Moorena producens 3L]